MTVEVIFNLAWVGAVIAFFLPLVTSAIKRASWSVQAKRITALLIAAVAGIVNVGVQAGWEFTPIGEFAQLVVFSVAQIFVAAAAVYRGILEDTGVDNALTALGDSA